MRLMRALLAVSLFAPVAMAQGAQQPSLGEVVRQDKETPKPKATRVITDDDLKRGRPLADDDDAAGTGEAPVASDQAAAQPKSEQEEAIDRLNDEVQSLEAEVEALKQKSSAGEKSKASAGENSNLSAEEKANFSSDDSSNASAIAELLGSREAELANARKQLDELKEKAAKKTVVAAPASAKEKTETAEGEEPGGEPSPGEPD